MRSALFNHFLIYKKEYIYLFSGIVLLIIGRWASILYPLALNPDEAQTAANALRIKHYGLSWEATDGTTVGPLNTLAVMWPYLFGADVTFSTIRLSALIYISLTFVFLFLSIKKISGFLSAILFSFPYLLFFSLTEYSDFQHYSSEIFPVFLLSIGNYCVLHLYKNINNNALNKGFFVLAGIVIGMIPFSKLQSSPIAVVMTLFVFILIYKIKDIHQKRANILLFILSLLVPAVALMFPSIINDSLHHFLISYIMWAFVYVSDGLSFNEVVNFINHVVLYKNVVYFLAVSGFALYVSYAVLIVRGQRKDIAILVYSVILVLVSLYVVARPGNYFPHYLVFLLPFLCVNMGVVSHKPLSLYPKYTMGGYIVLFVIFLSQPIYEHINKKIVLADNQPLRKAYKTNYYNSEIFSWLFTGKPKHMLVWGWMPQWYVWSDITPASRETITFSQIVQNKYQEYFRKRLISDVKASKPEIIIDAATGQGFYFTHKNKTDMRIFPELNELVANQYTRIGNINNAEKHCPTVYLRNDSYSEFKKRNVEFLSIRPSISSNEDYEKYFSSENINDFSVTEDACFDYWLIPNGRMGALDITFTKLERVSQVFLMNTHNMNNLDAASDLVRITLFNKGNKVDSRELKMNLHPKTTVYKYSMPVEADKMRIEVLSKYGRGAGLNEIKVFRDIGKI